MPLPQPITRSPDCTRQLLFLVLVLLAVLSQRLNTQTPPSSFRPSSKSIADLKVSAERGVVSAQFALANAYLSGEGEAANPEEAAKWFRKAAEQNDPLAQFALGMMLDEGKGVPANKAEAISWYRKAAQQGVAEAQFNLGTSYSKGEGVPQDHAEAAKWFRTAAENGDLQGQVTLGLILREGRGLKRDGAESSRWLRKAAYQGEPVAQFFLGLAFLEGLGVETNRDDGLKWVRRAADQGHAEAQFFLGEHAGLQDAAEARLWLDKAAAQGHSGAQKALALAKSEKPREPDPLPITSTPATTEPPNSLAAPPAPTASVPASVNPPSALAVVQPALDPAPRPSPSLSGGQFPALDVPPRAQGSEDWTRPVAWIAAGSSLTMVVISLAVLAMFRQRLKNLSLELGQTRMELSRANEHLNVMVNFVEKRLAEIQSQIPRTRTIEVASSTGDNSISTAASPVSSDEPTPPPLEMLARGAASQSVLNLTDKTEADEPSGALPSKQDPALAGNAATDAALDVAGHEQTFRARRNALSAPGVDRPADCSPAIPSMPPDFKARRRSGELQHTVLHAPEPASAEPATDSSQENAAGSA